VTTAVAVPEERLSSWDRFLFAPESPAPAALLRIVYGVLATAWAITLIPDVDPFLTRGKLYYGGVDATTYWNPLDWTDWRGAPMAVCILLVVAGAMTAIGLFTRVSAIVAFVCMLALQRTNPIISNSGDLVLRHIGLAVALAPSGLLLSVDALRARRRAPAADEDPPPPLRAPWALRFLQIDIAVGYFLSMWPKLRGDTWHDGTAMGLALRITDVQRWAPPQWLFDQSVILNVLTWGTLAFEASFLFLVWRRRWRPWVLGIGVMFHLGIDIFIDVGFFSYAMMASYLAFLPPEVADRIVTRIRARLPRRSAPDPAPTP
jgi:hypothetical protein